MLRRVSDRERQHWLEAVEKSKLHVRRETEGESAQCARGAMLTPTKYTKTLALARQCINFFLSTSPVTIQSFPHSPLNIFPDVL